MMRPKAKNKIENIVSKYTDHSMNGSAVAVQDLVKKLNGSGLKEVQ